MDTTYIHSTYLGLWPLWHIRRRGIPERTMKTDGNWSLELGDPRIAPGIYTYRVAASQRIEIIHEAMGKYVPTIRQSYKNTRIQEYNMYNMYILVHGTSSQVSTKPSQSNWTRLGLNARSFYAASSAINTVHVHPIPCIPRYPLRRDRASIHMYCSMYLSLSLPLSPSLPLSLSLPCSTSSLIRVVHVQE